MRAVIFVGGPSGAGKTTLVNELRDLGDVYEERGLENPHLARFRAGDPLDAAQNQQWFLDRIRQFVGNASTEFAIVDQMPFAISGPYAKLFLEEGLLSESQIIDLQSDAATLLNDLRRRQIDLLDVVLSARSEVLWERLINRDGGPRLPQSYIFRVNQLFQNMLIDTPTLAINTEVATVSEEADAVRAWIREGA